MHLELHTQMHLPRSLYNSLPSFDGHKLALTRCILSVRKMQYGDDLEAAPSTIPPLQGVAVNYKSTLDSLLLFVHDTEYSRDKTHTKGELRALTPENILHWMNLLKAFGVSDPPADANPDSARSNSLAFWKKTISFVMPNRLTMVWTSGRNEGNPT